MSDPLSQARNTLADAILTTLKPEIAKLSLNTFSRISGIPVTEAQDRLNNATLEELNQWTAAAKPKRRPPPPLKPNWLKSLPANRRELVYAEMRTLNDQVTAHNNKAREMFPVGMIPVGGAHMDNLIPATVKEEFLFALNAGKDLKAAHAAAMTAGKNCVIRFNQNHPAEFQVHRWVEAGNSIADALLIQFVEAADGQMSISEPHAK